MARTRDTIDICRKVWSGDKVTHDGKAYSLPYDGGTGLGKPLKFMNRPPVRDIPISIASIGPRKRRTHRRSGRHLADDPLRARPLRAGVGRSAQDRPRQARSGKSRSRSSPDSSWRSARATTSRSPRRGPRLDRLLRGRHGRQTRTSTTTSSSGTAGKKKPRRSRICSCPGSGWRRSRRARGVHRLVGADRRRRVRARTHPGVQGGGCDPFST